MNEHLPVISSLELNSTNSVTSSRSSISFITESSTDTNKCLVFQRPAINTTGATTSVSEAPTDQEGVEEEKCTSIRLMIEEQYGAGYFVHVEDQSTSCRTWFKLGCCVQVMFALDARGLPYDAPLDPHFQINDPVKSVVNRVALVMRLVCSEISQFTAGTT